MSDIVSQTTQGAALSLFSNLLAQIITSYKENTLLTFDLAQTLKFVLFSIVSSPPNIIWQTFLEDSFPTNAPITKPTPEKANGKPNLASGPITKKSKTNILIKFVLDMTLGAVVNTMMFLVFMGYLNTPSNSKIVPLDVIARELKEKFYPMLIDGYKLWPLFSLVSFLWIPVDKRLVAGCLVGIGWNIYLSMMVS